MSRNTREVQLHNMAKTPAGKERLVEILKVHMGLKPGELLPIGTILIQEILDHEFPG